ncbi:hypothetical protein PR002_g7791 [Phytophthora rubi]|uniref:Uncharacterized protein n=1 Tax=Phytophthora rubi TaxID=129364 RepID=A0A6A3MTT5_9STRA|nr:hypothetical protein PR002_g7791 [Phytophthora rubi]
MTKRDTTLVGVLLEAFLVLLTAAAYTGTYIQRVNTTANTFKTSFTYLSVRSPCPRS